MALFLLLLDEEDRRLLLLKDEAIDRRGVLSLEGDANDDGAASEDLATGGLSPNDARRGVVSRFNKDGFLRLGDLGGRDSTCGVTDRRLLTLVDILCVSCLLECGPKRSLSFTLARH
jgi:hypothetical protein